MIPISFDMSGDMNRDEKWWKYSFAEYLSKCSGIRAFVDRETVERRSRNNREIERELEREDIVIIKYIRLDRVGRVERTTYSRMPKEDAACTSVWDA